MADKISEALWKAFTKKHKLELDDKALLKALAALDKTDDRKPEPRLEALADLVKEIPKQVAALVKRKKELGDKPFGLVKDELYAILEEAEALHKQAQAALDAEDDEDEDSVPSALVNPKLLLKQLVMCRNDPDRTMKFAFVDAKDRQPAMLALHPRMGARALFGKLQAASGLKTGAYGTAWVDGTSLMLQLDKPLSGLVKKVRAPVRACGFKIAKAVLWNEDGTVFEQDELPDEAVAEAPAPAAPGTPGAPAEAGQGAPPQPSVTYEAKLAALLPRVKRAADDGSMDAPKHQKLLDFAAAKATTQDFLAAVAALRQVEQLLDNPTARPDAGTVDAGVAFKARLTAALPGIQAAIQQGGEHAATIKLKFGQIGVLAKKPDYPGAYTVLDEIEALLGGAAVATGTASTSTSTSAATSTSAEPVAAGDAKAAEVDALRARLQDDFDALQRGPLDPALRTRFQPIANAWMAAQDASAKNEHDRALLVMKKLADTGALAKLRQAMGASGASGGEAGGKGRLVRQLTFMLERWARIPAELRALLGPLRQELADSGADSDPQGLVDAIESALDDLLAELQDDLDAAINQGSTAGLRGVGSRFEGDALVQHLRSAPGVKAGELLKTVTDAVGEIESEMTRP